MFRLRAGCAHLQESSISLWFRPVQVGVHTLHRQGQEEKVTVEWREKMAAGNGSGQGLRGQGGEQGSCEGLRGWLNFFLLGWR
jgi:hypothetical protein